MNGYIPSQNKHSLIKYNNYYIIDTYLLLTINQQILSHAWYDVHNARRAVTQ